MGSTAIALVGFGLWFIILTLALVAVRFPLIASGQKAPNSFAPDGSDLDPFGRRVTRARDNCFETLPLFAAIALGASMSGRTDVTDPLAMWVLYARVAQSIVHLISTDVPAIWVRATLFTVQIAIYLYWAVRLLFT